MIHLQLARIQKVAGTDCEERGKKEKEHFNRMGVGVSIERQVAREKAGLYFVVHYVPYP